MPKTKEEAPKETGIETNEEAMSAAEFKKIMAAYKEQNPVKYEAKKEALEAKLKTLK